MIAFWVVAGLLSALCAGLILWTSARSVAADGADPAAALYRRQLSEIDDLASRGMIPESERAVTRAEAARRLLAATQGPSGWIADAARRRWSLVAAAATPLAALGLYFAVGSPGMADRPFAVRVAEWRKQDPEQLTAPQMAVVLQSVIAERGGDPEAYGFLAQAQMASDNPDGAARALRRAIDLAPGRADLWEALGEVLLVQAEGQVTPQVRAAFAEAVKRDSTLVSARFQLARAEIESGDRQAGLTAWKALAAELPTGDRRRIAVEQAIAMAEAAPVPAPAMIEGDQMEAVRGMVAGLAARLETEPDDAEGWVRLVRSYAVLGDVKNREAALTKAKARFADRTDVLKALDLAAKTEPMR